MEHSARENEIDDIALWLKLKAKLGCRESEWNRALSVPVGNVSSETDDELVRGLPVKQLKHALRLFNVDSTKVGSHLF